MNVYDIGVEQKIIAMQKMEKKEKRFIKNCIQREKINRVSSHDFLRTLVGLIIFSKRTVVIRWNSWENITNTM